MTISRSDIERICNYIENTKPSLPKGNIYYMENLSSDDEWVINEHKRRNRQRNISLVLGEKIEKESDILELPRPYDDMQVTSPRMMSQSLTAKKFIDFNSLYDDILTHLDTITNNPMKRCKFNPTDLNVKITKDSNYTQSENYDINYRRIITKMTFLTSLISMKSMVGPPQTVIIGDKILDYFLSTASNYLNLSPVNSSVIGSINGVNIVHSRLINQNKLIAIRTSTGQSSSGLNVVNNMNNDKSYYPTYFMGETPTFEKNIAWFEII